MTIASVPPMRRFATWCTGHRKTVIIGWIVAIPALVVLVRVGVEGFLLPFDRVQRR